MHYFICSNSDPQELVVRLLMNLAEVRTDVSEARRGLEYATN